MLPVHPMVPSNPLCLGHVLPSMLSMIFNPLGAASNKFNFVFASLKLKDWWSSRGLLTQASKWLALS